MAALALSAANSRQDIHVNIMQDNAAAARNVS